MVSFGPFGQPDFVKTSVPDFPVVLLFLSSTFDEDDDFDMV